MILFKSIYKKHILSTLGRVESGYAGLDMANRCVAQMSASMPEANVYHPTADVFVILPTGFLVPSVSLRPSRSIVVIAKHNNKRTGNY